MNPVAKALWFIESHFTGEVTLAEISEIAGVSRFHMVRAFGMTTGYPVMRYVRGRRLTEAARALASGAPDILRVALDVGHCLHEAFSRAFRDQFGMTPEMVRAGATVDNLVLMEPFKMDETAKTTLQPPRRVAPQHYVVFRHTEHVSMVGGTFMAIFNDWLPGSGNVPADAPVFERFDGRTGMGGCEIWAPIKHGT